MSLEDVAMNNFERDQARESGDLESIGCYQSTDYSAMKEVKSTLKSRHTGEKQKTHTIAERSRICAIRHRTTNRKRSTKTYPRISRLWVCWSWAAGTSPDSSAAEEADQH